MSLDALKQPNITVTGSNSALETGSINATSTNIDVPVGQGAELGAPVDTVNASVNSGQAETTYLRSETEIKNALQKISVQTGLNINELLDIIQKMTGKSLSDLQNVEQRELTNITTGLGKILNDCKVDGGIDSAKLEQAIKDYNIAIQTGWTLEGFHDWQRNHKKQSLSDRLVDTNCLAVPLDPNAPDYEAKMEAAIEKFFEKTLLSRISPNTPQKEREQIYLAQLQTYGRLLINTAEGRDKELLGSAIDKLYRTNIVPAAKAGLQAMETEEAKANFARHIDLKEAVTTDSECEKDVYMAAKEAQELAILKYGNMNAKDIEADLPVMKQEAEEFFEKYKDILAIIDNKKEEELTPEERAIKRVRDNLHIGRYSGATTGIATSKNSTVIPVKEELLTTVNTDAYEVGEKAGNDFYREVLTQVAKYAESLPEEAKAEFKALMEKAIGENYTKVENDIANGTKTELSAPAVQAKAESPEADVKAATEVVDINRVDNRYSAGHEKVDLTKPQTMTAELYANNPLIESVQEVEQAPQNEAEAAKDGIKGVKEYIKTTGENILTTIVELLNLPNIGKTISGWAYEVVGRKNDSQKADICNNIKNNQHKMEVADMIHSYEALREVDSNNNLVRKHIEERSEILQERFA